MTVLYVASDQRGAGKTALCTALTHELNRRGVRAAAFKPLMSDSRPTGDPDSSIFQRLLDQPESELSLSPPAGKLPAKLLKDIKGAAEKMLQGRDVLLVEESSKVSKEASKELVEALEAKVIVVVKYQPGLNGSSLVRWRRLFGERLLGFVVNGLTCYMGTDAMTGLLPSMNMEGLVSWGVIPEDRSLLAVTVGQVASHLEGRFIVGEEATDAPVEHFMVGGLGLDSGVLYFSLRENKAVIVRGDRPDIQMAALQTPTACMVHTKGIEPIEYVLYEAELQEVPIILVQSDTLSTMASLDTVQDSARFDHPLKLERLTELLRKHLNISGICEGLGFAA